MKSFNFILSIFIIIVNQIYSQENCHSLVFKINDHMSWENKEPILSKNDEVSFLLNKFNTLAINQLYPNSNSVEMRKLYEVFIEDPNQLYSLLIELKKISYLDDFVLYCEEQSSWFDDPLVQGSDAWYLEGMEIPCAWEYANGENIVVAVIDEYLDYSHDDLEGKIHSITQMSSNSNPNCSHGFAMSGAIAAIINNGICTVGSGYNTKVAHYIVQGSSCGGVNSWQRRQAIHRAVADGHKIISVSSSGGLLTRTEIENYISQGVTFIHSAQGNTPPSSAILDGYIYVGQADNNFNHVGGDSYYRDQTGADLYALCVGVNRLQSNNSCNFGGGNTSFGAATIAGIVALMRSSNTCLTPDDIEFFLKQSVLQPIGNNPDGREAGVINACVAVQAAIEGRDWIVEDDFVLSEEKIVSGSAVIKQGTTLTVTGVLKIRNKLIIEKGAVLILDGGILTNGCGSQWQGIVIEGNGADQSGAGKLVMTNNAIIENAVDGISMNPTHIPWPDLASSWGGLVEASNSTIRNCNRAAAFMKMPNDRSFFNGCTFQNLNEGVTLWDNNGVNFQNCNFSDIQKSSILTFDSQINAIDNNISQVKDAIEIITSGSSIYESFFAYNTINAERYAINGTSTNGLRPLSLLANTLLSRDAAVTLDGISSFRFVGNNVIGSDFGLRLHSTGIGQIAEVINNTFSSTSWGSLVNHETNTEYQSNCFYYNGGDIQVNTGEINGEQGNHDRAANNCFTKNGAPSVRVINSASFDYHLAHIETPTCKTPTEYQDPNRGYELEWGAPEYKVYCSDPVYIKYRRCPLPKNAEDYAKMKKELEDEIKKIEANETMSQTLKDFLIKRYKNCLRKIQREIIIIILEEDDPAKKQDAIADAVNIAKTSEFLELNILGFPILMDNEMYAEAAAYLNQMNTSENSDALDYVTIQSINLGYYNNIGHYILSMADKNTLYNIGIKTTPISGLARGLYYKLTGEKMEVDWIYEGSLVEFRNKQETGNKELLIEIYPNPVDDNVLNILLNQTDMEAGIKADIYDTQGNNVKNLDMSGQNHVTIDVSDMASGVYIVSFLKDGQWVKTQRFVKL